ncbi:predicted protein [Chaetomium globosum CBS 148.51]|uniref:Uncharacterized protein n=1 Tax=Chaetomium globosum (strain ATCC 6205 / CBS 148.51 / DSM 1962 / NBRC 6347 / NRRL 1970) TaxID=306901 RepID=Q2H6S2_CHAGB|nr:uncharacterized protein CHGG_05643 [Chaetomium globosum CBS 148.51]EAQ89024.1 predicted protein [Chaetomium globosum CBS 148.51]
MAKPRPFWRFTKLRSQWTEAADHGSAAGVRSRQRRGWTTALNSYERRQYRLPIPEHEHRWPVYLGHGYPRGSVDPSLPPGTA